MYRCIKIHNSQQGGFNMKKSICLTLEEQRKLVLNGNTVLIYVNDSNMKRSAAARIRGNIFEDNLIAALKDKRIKL